MELNIIDIISIILVFVSLLFAVFLFTLKTENRTSNLLLGLFLVINAQDAGSQFVGYFIYPYYPGWGMLISSTIFFKMPLLYLYILSVIYADFKLKPKHLLHCIPFVIITIVLIPRYYGVDFDGKMSFNSHGSFDRMPEIKFMYLLVHLQIIGYLIASFFSVKKYKTLLLENYSNASLFNYKWLFTLLVIFAIESGVASIKNVYMFLKIEDAYYYSLVFTSILALGFIIWLVFKALQSPEFFRGIDSNLQLVKNIANEEEKSDSNTERDTEIQILIDKLELFMKQNEPYLDPSLTLYNLAKQIEIPDRDLSILINRDLDQHFFDFVNGYRIRKSMEILRDPNKSEFTVLEILYDVGFNSKSSFNTAFKKYTGLTPTQFRKKNLLSAA